MAWREGLEVAGVIWRSTRRQGLGSVAVVVVKL